MHKKKSDVTPMSGSLLNVADLLTIVVVDPPVTKGLTP
jgi:hypothetical protein